MKRDELIEKVAITIYQFEGGMDPNEYEDIVGKPKENWRNIHKFQEGKPELAEHERDEYRTQAFAVINRLMQIGVIEIAVKEKECTDEKTGD